MARNRFGGDAASWLFATSGEAVVIPGPGKTVTAWSGPPEDLSRVSYDDLRGLEAPSTSISAVPVLSSAQVPEFDGPDDAAITRVWISADEGTTGVWITTTTIAKVAATGSYADLTGKPTIGASSWNDLADKPTIPSSAADVHALPDTYTPPAASTSTPGVLPIASPAEATAGNDNTKAMTPARVKQVVDALWTLLVNGAPVDKDTFAELAAIIANDETGLAAVTSQLGNKVNSSTYNAAIAAIRDLSDTALAGSLSAAFVTQSQLAVVKGTNQTAIDAALAQVATAGGTVLFPPGDYTGVINLTANAQIAIFGYGATLKAQANGATLLRVSQLDGGNAVGCTVQGLKLDGNGKTGVVGAAFEDTDGAYVRDLYIKNCATGVLFHAVGAGKWVERCTLADTFITGATVGVEFRKEAAAMPSFNEVALRNVGTSQASSIGIKQGTGCDFTRTTWSNVTVWCPDGAIGVEFDGRLDYARLEFGIESLGAGTGSTAIHFGPNYTNYSDPWAHHLEVSIVGAFATKIDDDSTDGAVMRDGSNVTTTKYAPAMIVTKLGDAYPRYRVGSSGIEVGDGASPAVMLAQSFYGPFYKSFVSMLFQSEPGFPLASANGGAASKSARIHDTSDAWGGYLGVYSTPDGPSVVPSNTQTGTTYTLVAGDAGKAVTLNNAGAITLTVPPSSSVAYTIGTVISLEQLGAGQVTITPGAGVTINSRGALTKIAGQYGAASLRKIATDTWLLAGDLA